MMVVVNGESREVPEDATVGALLRLIAGQGAAGSAGSKVAVEVNLQVVKRADLETTLLKPGDQVEIVAFVGGG